jgi:hypothetical protein
MVCVTPFVTSVSEPVTGVNLLVVPTAADAVMLAPKPENIQNMISLYITKHTE